MSIIGSTQPVLAPLVSPLPDPPAGEPFTPEQWATLLAIMDTVVPSVQRGAKSGSTASVQTLSDTEYDQTVEYFRKTAVGVPAGKAFEDYLNEKPSDNPRFRALLKRSLLAYAREDARKNLTFILSALK
jgi:hypothetical protein